MFFYYIKYINNTYLNIFVKKKKNNIKIYFNIIN